MAYRRGPFALHALSEYMGTGAVNRALRSVLEKHDRDGAPLATTMDLYEELWAEAPDSLAYLLHDIFEVNAFWELKSEHATARQTDTGAWQVTMDVQARKVVADLTGEETEVPLDEWIEIGVFGAPQDRWDELGAPLDVARHRIRSGQQTLTITVPERPVLAGVDPYHVLDWVANEDDDNIVGVSIQGGG